MARQGQAFIRRARSSSAGSKQRRPHHGLPSYSPTTTCEQLRPSALTGRSNPPSLRASPADELHHFTDLPQLCTARNPHACQMHVRAGHSRGRCTCCNGGEEKRGGGGDGVPGARTWIDCLWPQLVTSSSKTTWNYFIFTHTAPRRVPPTRHPPGIPNPAQRAPAPPLTPGGDSTPFS